jgi:hypothetical protein
MGPPSNTQSIPSPRHIASSTHAQNHLIYSNIASTAAREALPKDHPLRRFLKPFNHRTPSVNLGAHSFLTTEYALLHRAVALTYKGLTDAFNLGLGTIRIRSASKLFDHPLLDLEDEMAALGDDFPYARDGMDFYKIVHKFVEAYVHVYYKSDEDIRKDDSLRSMWNAVRVFGDSSGLVHWSVITREAVIDITATYIFHVTGVHHVVGNVAEYLMNPAFATGRIRAGREVSDVESSMYGLLIAILTGAKAPKLMNNFEHLLLHDEHLPATTDIFRTFQADLAAFSVEVHRRNEQREWKFYGFDPSRMLSSVSI